MKLTLCRLGLILLMTGCIPHPSTYTSGIEGQVWVGPMCPVLQSGQACPDRPYQARLTILNPDGEKVASLLSGVDGSFRLSLAPGDYLLRPESPGGMLHAPEQPFSVLQDRFTRLTVSYDSGIR